MKTESLFFYNIVLIVLYSSVAILALMIYKLQKKKYFLWTGILAICFSIDDIIIFMSEFLPSFAAKYNQIFMIVPTHKTLLYTVCSICFLLLFKEILHQKTMFSDYIPIVLCAVFMLFIPVMDNCALKIWLYYLPTQLYMFCLGIYGFLTLKKKQDSFPISYYRFFHFLFVLTIILNIAIVVEDTIVIFNFDTYSKYYINMNSRSATSDILYILYSIFAFIILQHELTKVFSDSSDTESISLNLEAKPDMIFSFCEKYHFTAREREIFKVLLDDKTNLEISSELYISQGTAKTHVHNIFHKIGVTKRSQLIAVYQNYIHHSK